MVEQQQLVYYLSDRQEYLSELWFFKVCGRIASAVKFLWCLKTGLSISLTTVSCLSA